MQLVIDIPDEIRKSIFDDVYCGIIDKRVFDAIKHGIPLPKGHGRLIDADVFEKRLMRAREYYIGEKADNFDLRFAAGLKAACLKLVDSPTIIEADKESEE